MSEGNGDASEPVRPHLWNPSAAAAWSLVFSPAFGAYLHAVNWRALGVPERATASLVWVGLTAALLVINLGLLFVPDSKIVEGFLRASGIALLAGWYVSLGRMQTAYVKETLRNDYVKKGWTVPLLVGFAGLAAYLAVVMVVVTVADAPDTKELADEIKPLIVRELQKKPGLEASVQNVILTHKGGAEYEGFVDLTLQGRPQRFALEVVLDGGTISWKLKSLADQ